MLTSTGISKTTSQNELNFGDKIQIPTDNLDERLQRVKPLCYPPANPIRGKLSFTGVVSVTLNFHGTPKEGM